jgi:hypothetical protein
MQVDVCVVGGGSGGFAAALAAARLGLEVVLVEKSDQLGGNSVRGGVNCWEPGVGGTGIPFDLYRRLLQIPQAVGIYSFGRHICWPARGFIPGGEALIDPSLHYVDSLRRYGSKGMAQAEAFCRQYWHGVVFEPEAMDAVMKLMLIETGHCRILLNTALAEVRTAHGRVESVVLGNGATVQARVVVDGTADALVCVAAGCETMTGQESRDRFGEPSAPEHPNARVNGVTLLYRTTPVPTPAIETPAVACWWRKDFPVTGIYHYPNGDLNLNMLPSMEGEEFMQLGPAAAYEECRRRVLAHWADLQTRYEEFRGFRLKWISPALGVRETRRVVGEVVLAEQHLKAGFSGQRQDDLIAIADHALDRHGAGGGCGELTEPYGVPFGCLIPKGYRNLLVACRGAGFSSLAASSCRLSRTMMQLGQAAGTAAFLACEKDLPMSEVAPERLRSMLREQHAQVDWPTPPELQQYLAGG